MPLTLRLTLTDQACAPLAGRAVYVWQCDRDAQYSMYTLPSENYLRGVQATDAQGVVELDSIFPACYAGRWPHVHFMIYRDLAAAASSTELATSQLALPRDVCEAVYATAGYAQSVANLARVSLSSDGVFRDGAERQTATVVGSVAAGYTATLGIAI